MLWRLTLAVALVCVGGMCSCVRADVMSRLVVPRDYGVKLCGREFIRAVIFTCGGSRWRRSTERDSDSFLWSPLSDVPAEDSQHTWQSGTELTAHRSPAHVVASQSLSDLLALYVAVGDAQQQQQQQQQQRQQRQEQQSDPSLLEKSQAPSFFPEQDERPLAAGWTTHSKRKRNFSLGVAGMCCSQGCTKNDIGRLC